ncbi:fas apoptotic inhibitory molecule 1 isoform X1 [Rhipicephalus microplus]|uniref:fas apoptotic inhibitory molecule 1 isoform X1 n=1 Tax=Rhipicephalus microplus TaxID=6941 RepID=UPI003F6D647A
MADTVAIWEVPFSDKIHKIEFEHGTTTGKRVIRVDGKEVVRRDWMFKLVGSELFEVGRAKCMVVIKALSGFTYQYSLIVDGKQLDKFRERQSKILNTWIVNLLEQPTRVVLAPSVCREGHSGRIRKWRKSRCCARICRRRNRDPFPSGALPGLHHCGEQRKKKRRYSAHADCGRTRDTELYRVSRTWHFGKAQVK